ncbi:1,4-alpha-glucan branching protein GlgB [Desulfuribacillus alkaliarsenatis]|uniref:1,4-alpha-glucan branching enzyme GlgB n=1 Tax=Desulfuribacillus alkaliarsenatis TaxID=766136 RepID=A0A1E5G0D5_9FIRM|nr:1,4-alpha-glucan branching protein GlgB [Desulfuribacillus alkaliarsenatis]OEF96296.1 1,4-alpha-glucan branching enzyme [Desulfuribacillus alkaliarsenatis]
MKRIKPSKQEIKLFQEGKLYNSYQVFGAHPIMKRGCMGVRFAVWAPNARQVSVVGSFNSWDSSTHVMEHIDNSGIWYIYTENAKVGDIYKYAITSNTGEVVLKADPYAFAAELRPNSASIITELSGFTWTDKEYLNDREKKSSHRQPINIYEVHLGSWRRKDNGDFLNYRELATELVDYVVDMGYTHIELLPVMEHPYDGSWGYQLTGYFAVTSRYGKPEDFMYLINECHNKNIGVILDWVPSHFCKDCHGLAQFDGMPLYEYDNPQKADKGEWGTLSFDFAKPQVQSFLISNALYWLKMFHIDGLRVDAVASMIYLNFGKEEGQWTPNIYGGNENLEAVAFLRRLNEVVFDQAPNALVMAEESTSWPLVSAPTYLGGLGFNYKWNMGWMNDTLKYMELDPIHRKWHHKLLTFSFFYAFSENFLLPLSHDEVVHGKKSLLNKMPGDYWQKFASLRVFLGYMMTHPGKKLLFMGGEFGQFIEWNENQQLDWLLLDYEMHKKLQDYVRSLNHFYKCSQELWELDHEQAGFEWIDADNYEQSIIAFMRQTTNGDYVIIICNFTPIVYHSYRVGVPENTTYIEAFNSDAIAYGGSGQRASADVIQANNTKWHNQPYSIEVTVPPLAIIIIQPNINDGEDK